jgi:hypothetical protein
MNWEWLPPKGTAPRGGLIAACGDSRQGDRWWFVHTDGLYTSPDGRHPEQGYGRIGQAVQDGKVTLSVLEQVAKRR